MINFSSYDSFLDAVFVLDKDKRVIYCNEAAANMAESSMKRLTKGKPLYDVLEFNDNNFFPMENGEKGLNSSTNYIEIEYKVIKSGVKKRVQAIVDPLATNGDESYWQLILHDVTLEETLHTKYHSQLDELENYSKNLEKMVEERTREVQEANKMMKAMMNSLGQGFIVIDKDGVCGDIYTKSCIEILEKEPSGKSLNVILGVKAREAKQFNMWLETSFAESLPFESLKELGPRHYKHSKDKHIILDFFPIRNKDNSIENIVMVATDKTAEHLAQAAMEKEKKYSEMILKIIKNKEQFTSFIKDLEPKINHLVKFTKENSKDFDIDKVLRFLHTVEGEAGVFGLQDTRWHARKCQKILEPLRSGTVVDPFTVRNEFTIEVATLAYNFEKFLKENEKTFKSIGIFGGKKVELTEEEIIDYYKLVSDNDPTSKLANEFKKRFIYRPIKSYLTHYEDLVKLIAGKQGKEIPSVEYIGCDEKIDKYKYQTIFNNLVHVFRNTVDHGVEEAEERLSQNKPAAATITITSEFKDGKLHLTINDDGRGIDPKIIRQKLVEKKLVSNVDALSDEEVIQCIFMPGFTSRESVGEFSGRGVGMDALKTEVDHMGGEIVMQSNLGKGSCLHIILPECDNEFIKMAV